MPRILHPCGWSVRRAAACLVFPAAGGTARRGGVHPGQLLNFGIPVRQTECVSGALQLYVQVVAVVCLNDFFEFTLLCGKLIEVGIRLGVLRVHFIRAFQGVNHVGDRFFNGLTHGMFGFSFGS